MTHVFYYYNTLWTDITKIAGKKKVHGACNLALILPFLPSNGTGKRSPAEITHCSCFNAPPLISWAAQIKDRPFCCVWCGGWLGAVGRSRQHKALCLPGLCWAASPRPMDSARLLCAAGKMFPVSHLEKWNSSQHRAGGKNNHGFKINTVEIALGMQTRARAHLHLWKKGIMHTALNAPLEAITCEHSPALWMLGFLELWHSGAQVPFKITFASHAYPSENKQKKPPNKPKHFTLLSPRTWYIGPSESGIIITRCTRLSMF